MKVLKSGTKVKTIVGELSALITGVCIEFDSITYRISYFYQGEHKTVWVYRYEIEVEQPKQTAGFNSVRVEQQTDNEVTLISN